MATERSERFDEIDWDEVTGASSRLDVAINTKLMILATAPLAALFAFDWVFVGDREATFEELGHALGLSGPFETIGADWNLEGLDFLFIFTLLLFVFYMLLPLYQNPRMTKYYWKEFKRNRPAVVSLVWLGIVFAGGLLGPLFVPQPEHDVTNGFQPPAFYHISDTYPVTCAGEVSDGRCYGTWEHPLGTTQGGRDILDLLIHGMTVSMQIAFITTLIVALIGVSFGTVSAFSGGWVDELLMRFTDIVLSFPTLLFFIMILYIYGASLALFIFIFAVFAWGGTARYVRSKALSVTEEEFIKATRISGASKYRIVRRHVVPNTASSIITQLTLLIPAFLLAEAQLSFLELGATDVPSWGQVIASGRDSIEYAPWIILAPGMLLFLTILAFNFLGDALLDALNPEAEAEAEK